MAKHKVCFASSSGGHFEQLLMLKPLMDVYDSFIVTEKTDYDVDIAKRVYYLKQVNRHERNFLPLMFVNFLKSCRIVFREKPDVIITTGVLAIIPLCLVVKIRGGKVVYIESFAKVNSPTLTGKLIYKFADQFYVQWESMKKFYPNAIYLGGIY
ncbi:PssD/Cps14F family polysaccharide biosynthesis glycosyltransferase [Bifidobacterium merycicum]|uniref:EpsG n=1 Tax=Bifidobacterium merycicum TaxID=78345 RepID=A0A087BF24_9BIFI|nr:PssD/Cps14F family polysaccharide biosynthesis glycosyltransferase [Bifidobacterium merycicum]KFI69624.1 EpsG [Bifidobacterium merycicum]SHE78556.1 UDP-N-acetylglucosamine:LPS N-acetylglucosamine transferase [Bifidobacterium merycicum DSM 6492]